MIGLAGVVVAGCKWLKATVPRLSSRREDFAAGRVVCAPVPSAMETSIQLLTQSVRIAILFGAF